MHPYGLLSLLPPVAAIALAIATRRVVLSLLAGIFAGALILNQGNPFLALADSLEQHLWPTLTEETNLRIYAFTLLMGAAVAVISRSGGMQGLIHLVTPWAKDRRRGQLATWGAGLLIFFDDYANTILLGNTLRSFCDKLRISREKLAYLVDSTAAPVAGLAPLSTWVAVEVRLIEQGLTDLNLPEGVSAPSATNLFLQSIPYRFYAIWMLVLVALVALLRRDFGPMYRAEKLATAGRDSPGKLRIAPSASQSDAARASWLNAVLPIGTMLGVLVWLLAYTGTQSWQADHPQEPGTFSDILGSADSSLALAYAALAGLILAALLGRLQAGLTFEQIGESAAAGANVVLPALAILVCAMSLSAMTRGEVTEDPSRPFPDRQTRLYSGVYLQGLLTGSDGSAAASAQSARAEISRRSLLGWSLPTVIFVLASIVAFCTGTSYGTMGILMPMTVPLAYAVLDGAVEGPGMHPVLLGSVGSVLAGSIFGDHCSPISDTTVLSSQASACDHIAHVWTQMPYALAVGAVTIIFGTLPLGFGVPVWGLLPLGVAVLVGLLLVLGRSTEEEASS